MQSTWAILIPLAASLSLATEPPPLMLWAWEQPIDLRFLAGRTDVGVAYLAATAFLQTSGVKVRYRAVSLNLPQRIHRVPVLRVEARGIPPSIEPLLQLCDRLISDSRSKALQIDFDAPARLRPTYSNLIRALRQRHGNKVHLSMTLLAGWCENPWFQDLPIDEHVVMLFRLGKSGPGVLDRVRQNSGFALPACREAIGYSTDERLAFQLKSKRTYWFSPSPWSQQSFASLPR